MKSEIVENSGLKRVLKVSVDPAEVTKALDSEFSKIQKDVALKGFRKGKAPMDQVKAMYGEKVSQTVLETLVNANYFDALQEHSLSPITLPKIDVADKPQEGEGEVGGFTFTAEFEVKPEIKIGDLSKLTVTKEVAEVTDEKVDNVIEQIKASQAEVTPLLEDRPAKEKDWVKLDFTGILEDGTKVPNGESKDFLLELGSGSLIPGFEDGIAGMKIGEEKTLNLKFPDDYFEDSLAGTPVNFLVKLNSINKKDFPEINDDFAKKAGPFNSLQELKDKIKEDTKASEEKRVEQKLNDDLLNGLGDIHDFDLPDSIVLQQAESFKNSTTQRLMSQGFDQTKLDEYHSKWEDEYKENAKKSVKLSLLVEAIAQQENLFPKENDISEYFDKLSSETGIDTEKIKSYYAPNEKQRELEFKLMEENVISFLKDKATIS